MTPLAALPLHPRKSPVQARSAASVDAILEATIQVLLATGKERLTTSRVAARAGVSVGTLYQYFPNKNSLLQAVLRLHFAQVTSAVEEVCTAQRGQPLAAMGRALALAFLAAKMRDPATSKALYAVSSDVDGLELARQIGVRMQADITAMLSTAAEGPLQDPALVASIVQGAMAGVSRRLLESDAPDRNLASYGTELVAMVDAYLQSVAPQAKGLTSREQTGG